MLAKAGEVDQVARPPDLSAGMALGVLIFELLKLDGFHRALSHGLCQYFTMASSPIRSASRGSFSTPIGTERSGT